jgi:hypothetical protein
MKRPSGFKLRHALLGIVGASLLATTLPARADDDGNVVHWKTVIGIIQAGNLVGNVAGGGQPWSTTGGEAGVNLSNGDVGFRVRGLVLAGGNTIGTPGTINQVKGTLVCDAGGANTLVDTPLVTLSATGDAGFSGNLGSLPAACSPANVAFLVRIAANRWIANGAVRVQKDD